MINTNTFSKVIVISALAVFTAGCQTTNINNTSSNTDNPSSLPSTTSKPTSSPITKNTNSNWKTFSHKTTGVTLSYPSTWVTPEDNFISEKTFIAGEQDGSKTYNIIEIYKYATPLYSGYTNSEWFNKIINSKTALVDQREIRTKLTSGTVKSGEQYVIFTDEPSVKAQAGGSKQVKAYILKGQTIYQLTLDLYDKNGLDTFKEIIPTAVVN